MVMEYKSGPMVKSTKENGKKINSMVKVHLYGKMVKNTSVITLMVVKMAWAQSNGLMVVNFMACGKMMFGMV